MGDWWIFFSANGQQSVQNWGKPDNGINAIPVPGDYDGDGIADLAIWDPATGTWWVTLSSTGSQISQQWGNQGNVPVPGDYDGDGKTDFAVFDPTTGDWWVLLSGSGQQFVQNWGKPNSGVNAIPVPGDYDGDGKTDYAIWDPATGNWWVTLSSTGAQEAKTWGNQGNIPVSGDFDGDGETDFTVFDPATGDWWMLLSSTGQQSVTKWGSPNNGVSAIPVPGDYDGDGKTDLAIWDPVGGEWWITLSSTGSQIAQQWGVQGNVPVFPSPGSPISFAPHRISGQVQIGGVAISGVTINLTGTTATGRVISLTTISDADGNYSLLVPSRGTYTLVPFLSGYTFTPASTVFNGVSGNQIANLAGTIQTGTVGQNCSDITGTWTDGNYTYSISETPGFGTVSGTDTLTLPYGSITWTLSGQTTDGVNYSMRVYNPNPTTTDFGTPDQEDDFTLTNPTCTSASVTLTNQIPGTGSSFLGGGSSPQGGQTTTWSRQSTPPAAPTTADITVIAWVDKTKITLGTPQTPELEVKLNTPGLCSILLGQWATGPRIDLKGPADVDYANDWLLIHSANSQPLPQIDPNKELSAGDFRLFNRFQILSNGDISRPTTLIHIAVPGSTPDPCGVVPNSRAEAHQNNGYIGIDSVGNGVAQLAEGRLGIVGRNVNTTINGSTTPWIWSVIEFDASGNPIIPFDHAMFPTYSIYWNGRLIQTCPQSDPQSFIFQSDSYQRFPSQIPVTSGLTSCHN